MPVKSSVTSPLHCCSVECVPSSLSGGLFAVGMYELLEDSQARRGGISLYDRHELVASREMSSGVLDMKFHGRVLAAAMSSGGVELLALDEERREFSVVEGGMTAATHSEGLSLSVDWSTRDGGEDVKLAVSTQEGSVLVYDYLSSGMQQSTALLNVHSLLGEHIPAWITAFNPHNPAMLVSGGDDCCLKLWDLRCPGAPVHNMSKFFTAGVTSAQWCPYRSHQHMYAAGSYDGSIALWDERMNRRAPLATVDSGGGVWRLKWKPQSDDEINGTSSLYLAAASMHNGSGIHKVGCDSSGSDGSLTMTTIETQVDVNESRLVYGMDWLRKEDKSLQKDTSVFEETIAEAAAKNVSEDCIEYEIATCSFYDNLVQIWGS